MSLNVSCASLTLSCNHLRGQYRADTFSPPYILLSFINLLLSLSLLSLFSLLLFMRDGMQPSGPGGAERLWIVIKNEERRGGEERGAAFLCSALREVFTEGGGRYERHSGQRETERETEYSDLNSQCVTGTENLVLTYVMGTPPPPHVSLTRLHTFLNRNKKINSQSLITSEHWQVQN